VVVVTGAVVVVTGAVVVVTGAVVVVTGAVVVVLGGTVVVVVSCGASVVVVVAGSGFGFLYFHVHSWVVTEPSGWVMTRVIVLPARSDVQTRPPLFPKKVTVTDVGVYVVSMYTIASESFLSHRASAIRVSPRARTGSG